jgi:hypothetical protein
MSSRIAAAAVILIGIFYFTHAFSGSAKLPVFSLKDPQGEIHHSKQLKRRPLVIIYTAPTLKNEGAQKKWCDVLTRTRPKRAHFVMIEDMSATSFRAMASNTMKKEWKKGDLPLLLLDESGELRARLGADRGATCVFAYRKGGRLVHVETGAPSLDSAKAIWAKVR